MPNNIKFYSLDEAMQTTSVLPEKEQKFYRLNDVMALETDNVKKNENTFWGNMKDSFRRGQASADIDQAGYFARIGDLDFDKNVRPLVEMRQKLAEEKPIRGDNFVSNTLYQIAEMAPAMLNGIIEGKTTGALAAGGAAVVGQMGPQALTPEEIVTVPGAYAVGTLIGGFEYWRRQGTGSMYIEMKMQDEPLDDKIAGPLADIGGILYGSVEFSQIKKLLPGSDKLIKRLASDSLKKSIGRLAARFGINWATEVGEEGVQQVIQDTATEVGNRIAGQSNKTVGNAVRDILLNGWQASVDSALPMLFLMGPGTAVDTYRTLNTSKDQKIVMDDNVKKVLEVMHKLKESGKAEGVTFEETLEVEQTPTSQEVAKDPLIEEAKKYKTAEGFFFDKLGKGENEVFYHKIGDNNIEIIKNPTARDRKQMSDEFKKEFPQGKGEPPYRTTYDEFGNVYIFRSDKSTHGDIEPFLRDTLGVYASQDQWTGKKHLTQIWEQAQKGKGEIDSLIEEAKKYKTAEEFVSSYSIKKNLERHNISVNDDNTVTLYHATHPGVKEKILREGFIKGGTGAPGGMTGLSIKDAAFLGADKKWVSETWGGRSGNIVEVKVPVQYLRQPAQNEKEFYFEGGLKLVDKKNNVWEPAKPPRKTFYNEIDSLDYDFLNPDKKLTQIWEQAQKEKAPIKKTPKALKQRLSEINQTLKQPQAITRAEIKAYQSELISNIKDLDIDAKDKAKFLTSIRDANTQIMLEKESKKVYERAFKYFEAKEKRETKDKIDKELTYTKPVKQGQRKVGKYDYESNKFFAGLRDLNKINQETAQKEIDALPEGGDEFVLIKKRFLSYKANGMKGTAELHKQVLADIKKLKYLGGLAKNEQDFLNKVNRVEKITFVSDGIEKVDADKNTVKTKIGNLYRKGFANIYSMLNSIGGKNVADELDTEIKENDKVVAIFKKTTEVTKNVSDMLELKHPDFILEWLEERSAEDFELVDVDGLVHKISKMQILDIYNSIKNDMIRQRYFNAFGSEQIDTILDNLTQKEMLVADYMQEVVQEYFPILNKRSIETTGLDLGQVSNYWSATSEYNPDILDDVRVQGETPSAMKERVNSVKVFPVPKNAWYKMTKAISDAEHVDKLSPTYIELKRIFSNRKIKNQIVNKFGEDIYRTINDQLDNISRAKNSQRQDGVSDIIGMGINNWVTAKIAVSPSTFAKQLLSVINYSENMPSGKWSKGFFDGLTSPKETFDYMWNNSEGFLEQRFNRGYSEALNNALEGAKSISKNKYSWTKGLSAWVRAGDISAIIYGGYPYVKYLESQGMSKQEAFRKFKEATLKAQQSGLSSGRSQWQNNNNATARLLLAFKNTANQYFRKQVDAIISYQNGDISAEQLFKTTMIYSVINPILYAATGKAVAMGMKSLGTLLFGAVHDDEEDAESFLMDLLIQVLVNPFNAIPLLDDLSMFAAREMADKPTWKVFSTPVIDDIETGARNMAKDYITLEDYFETFGTVGEVLTGAPIKSALRYYKYLTGE
jgi:hypothetical protein